MATDVIDGGSYGLRSGDQVDFNSTNYGDCDMTIYTNKDHSAFPFDDTQLISKLYSSDFEDIIANGKNSNFGLKKMVILLFMIMRTNSKLNLTKMNEYSMRHFVKSQHISKNKNQSLSKALSDLQREAIADEMSNLY